VVVRKLSMPALACHATVPVVHTKRSRS